MTGINQRGRYGRYIRWILTAGDFIILNIAFFLTVALAPEYDVSRPRLLWLMANIAYIPAAYFLANTQARRTIAMEHVLANSFKAVLLHAPVYLASLFFLQIDTVPVKVFAEFYGLLFVLFPIWWSVSRLIVKFYRKRGRNFSKVVIVGTNPTAMMLFDEMTSDAGFGYRVLGFFDNNPMDGTPKGLYRGKISQLKHFIERHAVDEIFCTLPGTHEEEINTALTVAEDKVVKFFYVPQISMGRIRTFDLYAMGSMPVLSVRHQPLSMMRNRMLKRTFDLVFSSVCLIFSPLVFIPVAAAIKISSPGPIFFKQKRTGYRGREFTCYKFRTMKVNAAADTRQATKDDPRKTRVGDFLRRSSMDELPQFINVFLGDMSVVGPRPHMLRHTEQYSALIDKYMVRHYIKPGITGWAQINGLRGQTEELWQMEERVRHDVWYIEHWSFLLDLKIMFRTVFNALHGEKNAF
ncbi:MAG: undecaprenyl-phosphate glucose phosphotransferase [Firmicutes bacterium]|nr:undecaprenyl-phosphate glucose phosphotransferase [Bacillota bacterium]MCM1401362.1 undecaprenyl-phosphate glucose phosphotransferase [Bacteroides sp.]MCM1477387.1 undecaprenyl-phosphate glucose phosphotransferase [Bacteroides sp.]